MAKNIFRAVVVAAVFLSALGVLSPGAQEPAAPAAPTTALTPAVNAAALIREGVRLYDQGSYETAIQKYTQALELQPDNITALYERAMTFLQLEQFERCMADVEKGLQRDSSIKSGFYELAGTCYSTQNQLDKALQYYERGLKLFPKDEQLHFNIAIALNKMGRRKEARDHFKEVLELNPERESANLFLGLLYKEDGYKMPALLMYLRFLWAEPSSTRSKEVVGMIEALIGQGVTATDPHNITISLDTNAPTDEGDFGPLHMALSVSRAAAAMTEEAQTKSLAEQNVGTITNLVQISSEIKDRKLKKTFVWKHALSFLEEMQRDKVLEPFLYQELALTGEAGAQQWLDTHHEDLARLDKWVSDKGE